MSSGFHHFATDANEGNRDIDSVGSRSRVRMGMEFKDKIVLHGFREVKSQQQKHAKQKVTNASQGPWCNGCEAAGGKPIA